MVEPVWYFAVVSHQDAAEGSGGGVGVLRDWMKSTIMERWVGLNWPYQIRLTVILPFSRGPLWYFSTKGCSFTRAAKEVAKKRCKRRR